jgi:16S rRNA (adenine1518-N6/adenine1519-N6)-dimethyltransferase
MEPTAARVILSKHGLAPSKERGQNFLSDPNVAAKVVDAIAPGPDEVVVEVGPGFGAITLGLAERAKRVVAVEYDGGIARAFRAEHGDVPRVTLMEGDALDLDIEAVADEQRVPGVVIAGNLPYNLTSPVLRMIMDGGALVQRAVLMVQREVADRLTAAPGTQDYSALSAVLGFHAEVSTLFRVRRTCFYPRPAVDSSVVRIVPLGAGARLADPGSFSRVVHAAFGKRRKMLRRALEELLLDAGSTADELAAESGVDLERRGETLSIEEFETLALALYGEPRPEHEETV